MPKVSKNQIKTNSSFVESLYVSARPRNYTTKDYQNIEGAVQISLYHTISLINSSKIDLLIGEEDCTNDTVTAIRAIVHRSVIWLTLVLRVGLYVFRPIFNRRFKHAAVVKAERH